MIMYDIFLSHNRQQKSWVREFCQILRDRGLNVFFDEDSISPGENVVRAIERAIEDSRHVVLVISPSSMTSDWVAMEAAITVYRDPKASKRILLPVMLESIDLGSVPLSMRVLNFINLTNQATRDAEFRRLLSCMGIALDQIPSAPPWSQENKIIEESTLSFLTVADIDNVISWGWDGKKLLDELIKLDYQTIDDLTPDHEGHTNQWAPVFMDHPDTWRLLIAGPERIVGYWHFVPLFKMDYEKAKEGRLADSQITTDIVRVCELPGWYDIYFVSICALPIYRRTLRMRPLFKSFFDVATELALEGVFIKEICTNAYTPSGEALCKDLGFNFITSHIDHGKIYGGQFIDLLNHDLSNGHHELKRLYGLPINERHLKLV